MAPSRNTVTFQATILSCQEKAWEITNTAFDPKNVPNLPGRCYIFLRKVDYNTLDDRREVLLNHFKVPIFVANRACTEMNGYFGCKASYDAQGKVTACSTWFRCLVKMVRRVEKPHEEEREYVTTVEAMKKGYEWFEMGFFTLWDGQNCKALCVDTPNDLPTKLAAALNKQSSQVNFRDPFAMHADLLDQIILYYEISVWRVRDPVRELEESRDHFRENVFKPMHDVSRHAIHTAEILSATIETITELQRYQTDIRKILHIDLDQNYKEQANAYTDFQIQLLKSLKLRSESNHKRLEDEVNLVFNNLAHEDNTVMKSIALLTMVFLPATFLSALFSTTFFNFGDNGRWQASPRQWIYWATTVPVTFIVVAAYNLWLFYGRYRGFLRTRSGNANIP